MPKIIIEELEPFPQKISEKKAVIITYKEELDKIADYLRNDLSVLVACDKILVESIYEYVCEKANKMILIDKSYDPANLYQQFEKLRKDRIMVLRSVDLLDSPSSTFLVYHTLKRAECPIPCLQRHKRGH